jgi:hypothetical protein
MSKLTLIAAVSAKGLLMRTMLAISLTFQGTLNIMGVPASRPIFFKFLIRI